MCALTQLKQLLPSLNGNAGLRTIQIATFIYASLMFSGTTELEPFVDPDTGLNVFELINKYGFTFEKHTVTTKDNYILEMHRVLHGLNNSVATKGPALLGHGLLASSACFVNFKRKSLAFRLVEQGYDVWLGNGRGTINSRKHANPICHPDFNPSCFWDFSWHEYGFYDLPAMIDYILEKTSELKLHYIGHSMGCTAFLVLCSLRPEYNDKIKLATLLAPGSFQIHSDIPFIKMICQIVEAGEIYRLIGLYEFKPTNELLQLFVNLGCNNYAPFPEFCTNIIFLIMGYDSIQINRTMVPVISSNAPAGASNKNFLHYCQLAKSGRFRQYDYFIDAVNMKKYKQNTPPEYPLENITTPTAIYYGQNDKLATPEDVEMLMDRLVNCTVHPYKIAFSLFNHIDFLWAKDVDTLLHEKVFSVMDMYP